MFKIFANSSKNKFYQELIKNNWIGSVYWIEISFFSFFVIWLYSLLLFSKTRQKTFFYHIWKRIRMIFFRSRRFSGLSKFLPMHVFICKTFMLVLYSALPPHLSFSASLYVEIFIALCTVERMCLHVSIVFIIWLCEKWQ